MAIKKNKTRKMCTMNIINVAQTLQSTHLAGDVITADISTAWVEVGEFNIVRVIIAADTFFAFSDDTSAGTVTSTTSPAVKLTAGEHYIICSGKYIRASSNPSRVELLDV